MATTPRDDSISKSQSGRRNINVVQGEPVVAALRRAARSALLEHKRAGNPVASWRDGKVIITPAEEIQVEETPDDSDEA
ncbi:MAG TPA: hypothetical protein VGP08_02555 [Pyrinomonadaceae bacterium]|jgi:hypothetical protein|nr:hypothetical protein [Pyrinomonadaceae bacterium]